MKNACTDAITAALGREPTDKELDDIASAVQARLRAKIGAGMSEREAAMAVGKEMADEGRFKQALARRSAYENMIKFAELRARMVPGDEVRSEQAIYIGRESTTGRGVGLGIEQEHHGLRAQLLGPATQSLNDANLLSALKAADPAFDRDVARELYRLKDPALGPDTGNARAKAAAKVLGGVMDAGRALMNRAGAFIGDVEGYMGRQYHDMWKIRGAGKEADYQAWKTAVTKAFKIEDTFPGVAPDRVEAELRRDWIEHSTGVHGDTGGTPGGAASLARKVSQSRSYIPRSADSWLEYNAKYGKGGVMDAIWAGADHAARDAAVMQKLGTNPEQMAQQLHGANIQAAMARGDIATVDKLRGDPNKGYRDLVLGKVNHPVNQTIATIGATTRNVMQFLHLGGVVFSTTSDLPMTTATLRHNGVPLMKGIAGQLSSLLPQSAAAKEIAMAMHAGVDGMTGHIIHRFRAEDGLPGKMAEAVNTFHKWNGLTWETDAMKAGMGRALAHNLAFHSEKEFAALPELMQGTLRRYGIEAGEWDAARATAQRAADGRNYILPGDIADTAVSQKVWTYIADQIREGMNEPSLYAQSLVGLGSKPGTIPGEIIRSMTQFKAFTTTFMQRHGGRTFQRNGIDYPGAIYLLAGMTLAGYMSNTLRDFVANKTPVSPNDAAGWGKLVSDAMVTGGAAGLYGDMLFRSGTKSSGDIAKQLLGPAPATVIDLIQSAKNIVGGSNRTERKVIAEKEGIHLLQSLVPNIPVAKAAIDYMFLHFLTEAVAPGSVARRDRLLRQNGQQYILRP